MSDRRLRAPAATTASAPATSTPKRLRRASIRNVDDDKQRERKRALDRKAQRASREKTRSHIAHLEKMVQILSDKNGSTATSELMEEMNRLHLEIDRLRKIIDSIKSVLGADIFEAAAPAAPQRRVSRSPDLKETVLPELASPGRSNLFEVNSPSQDDTSFPNPAQCPDLQLPSNETTLDETKWDQTTEDSAEIPNNKDTPDEAPFIMASPKSINSFSWGATASDPPSPNRWDSLTPANKNKVFEHTPFWNLPCPLKTAMPEPPSPHFVPCKIWQKANSIYAGIFDYPRERIIVANKANSSSLFRVVKEGWGSLSLKERANPVLQILKEVDQCLFWDLDPVTKIANLYKSMLLLKYYFNATSQNLALMPHWQRPIGSQKSTRHPIPIDFFPWPSLRDRLIRHHGYYFSTSDFSVKYRQHFKFCWPFTFADTYKYDALTQTYRMSPLFEKYHGDMRCWSMERVFFERFPEFKGEISVWGVGGGMREARIGETGLGENEDVDGDMDDFEADGEVSFGDECVMELFNDYPPT